MFRFGREKNEEKIDDILSCKMFRFGREKN